MTDAIFLSTVHAIDRSHIRRGLPPGQGEDGLQAQGRPQGRPVTGRGGGRLLRADDRPHGQDTRQVVRVGAAQGESFDFLRQRFSLHYQRLSLDSQ